MEILFTNFYPLERLTPIIVEGALNLNWNKHYSSNGASSSRVYPDDLGSGQTLLAPKLLPQEVLPPEVQEINQTAHGLIYVLTSISYPILYVGISKKNLSEGFFGEGRISHHLRKLFAIHHVSTSHTQGWKQPAIKRYEDRVAIEGQNSASIPFSIDMSCVGSDLQIAFGYCNAEHWNCEDYEGTVFDYFESRLKLAHSDLMVMNTKKMNRSKAHISQPGNLDAVLSEFGSLDLLNIDHSLNLKTAAKHYAELKTEGPDSSLYYIATFSRVFKTLWEDSWKNCLYEMAQDWEVIDEYAELVFDAAVYSAAKPKFYKEFIEILDIYIKTTHIYMNDFDDKGEWKLERINQLLEISRNELSK